MTINEVEHAIRGLIVSQPMITAGPAGSTITGVLHTIETFKNFKLSIQSYPVQDSFKFINTTECQRLENTLCVSVCQVMQEKGLNIMGFLPGAPSSVISNPYAQQPVPPAQNPSMMGQMPFGGQPQFGSQPNQFNNQPQNNWQYQSQYTGSIGDQTSQFNMQPNQGMQPNMMNSMPKPSMNNQQMFQKMNQPPFGGNQNPSYNEQWQNPAPNMKPKSAPAFVNQFNTPSKPASLSGVDFNTPTNKSKKLNEVEMMQPMANNSMPTSPQKPKLNAFQAQAASDNNQNFADGIDEDPSSKAAGRDYLLKLLKTR